MSRAFIIDPTIGVDGLMTFGDWNTQTKGHPLPSPGAFKSPGGAKCSVSGMARFGQDKYAGKNRNHANLFPELADPHRQLISLIHDQRSRRPATSWRAPRKSLSLCAWWLHLTYIPVSRHASIAASRRRGRDGRGGSGALAYLVVKRINAINPQNRLPNCGVGPPLRTSFDVADIIKGIRRSVVCHKRAQRPERALGQAHGVGNRTVLRVVEPGVLLCGRPRL